MSHWPLLLSRKIYTNKPPKQGLIPAKQSALLYDAVGQQDYNVKNQLNDVKQVHSYQVLNK